MKNDETKKEIKWLHIGIIFVCAILMSLKFLFDYPFENFSILLFLPLFASVYCLVCHEEEPTCRALLRKQDKIKQDTGTKLKSDVSNESHIKQSH